MFDAQRGSVVIWLLFCAVIISSCNPAAPTTGLPIETPVEIPKATIQISSTSRPIQPTVTATRWSTPTQLPCGEDWCAVSGHFLLDRPISANDERRIEKTYSFGSTQEGKREVHHGVEFINPTGTPVLAAGEGTVAYAGNDHNEEYGWWLDYYGNIVIIEHSLPGYSIPIYSVYGHLSKVVVKTGETVKTGEKVGEVGAEGKAIGSHLHFEVRVGGMTYDDVQNPMLWLKPLAGEGVLAGSIQNLNGDLVFKQGLTVKSAGGKTWYPEIYGDPLLDRDPELNETFVIADLPAGEYEVIYSPYGVPYKKTLSILPGRITKVNFIIE